MKTETEVLIVGAGPTGLALSISLLQAGVDHLLIDRLTEGQNTSRAGVIHAQTLESLATLGVADDLTAHGLKIERFTIRDRDRSLVQLGFGALPSPHPYVLMLPQNNTEEILARRIKALGGEIYRGITATKVEQNAAGVRVSVTDGTAETTIKARYVIGADGMHSVVRQATSIGFEGGTYDASFILADVRMDWPFAQSEVSLFFSPQGLVVIAPLPDGSYRIVATYDDAPYELSVAQIQMLLDERGPIAAKAAVHAVTWSSRFRVHHRLANAYREGRLVLMGDAAHIHSPAGGQGMNTGLIDAVVLGQVLAGIVKDGRPDSSLDQYEHLRRPAAHEVLGLAGRLTSMATSHGTVKRWLRDTLLCFVNVNPFARRKLEMALSGLSRAGLARLPTTDQKEAA